jgi:hypothetical protein
MLRRVALVRTDVSEELSASFIRVTRIGELRTTPDVVTSQKTPLFIVTAVKTSNLTLFYLSVVLEWNPVHYYCSHLLAFFTTPGLLMVMIVE